MAKSKAWNAFSGHALEDPLQRSNLSQTPDTLRPLSKDGFYWFELTLEDGQLLSAQGVWVLHTGIVIGADVSGTAWDGSYGRDGAADEWWIRLEARPPGQASVRFELRKVSDKVGSDDRSHAIQTATGRLGRLRLRKLRGFP